MDGEWVWWDWWCLVSYVYFGYEVWGWYVYGGGGVVKGI